MKYLQTLSIAFVLVFFSFFAAPTQAHAGQVAAQVTNAVTAVTEDVVGAALTTVQVLSLGTIDTSQLADDLFSNAHCRGLNLTTDPLVSGSECGTALGTDNTVISVSATPPTIARGQQSVISWSSTGLGQLTTPNVTDSGSCSSKGGSWINGNQCNFGPSGSFNTDPLTQSTLFTFQGQAPDGSTVSQNVIVSVIRTNINATTSTTTNPTTPVIVVTSPLGAVDNPASLPAGSVTCGALQGTATTTLSVNKGMTWTTALTTQAGITLSQIDPSTISVYWNGDDVATVTNGLSLTKIYTTVGKKHITATLSGSVNGYYYSGSCDATTSVRLGSEVINSI